MKRPRSIGPLKRSEKYVRQGVEYSAWRAMLNRCYDPRYKLFRRYGGRGIVVCERWRESFDAFVDDMGRRPSTDHSLDRIDVNGNYEPANCRWATWTEQNRNRSRTHWIEFAGQRLPLVEWSERTGIPQTTIRQRIKYGWPTERVLSEPVDQERSRRRRAA